VSVFAGTIGWPCMRLNWAWRNVWVTCSLHAVTPVNAGGAGSLPLGWMSSTAIPPGAGFQLGTTGAFTPSIPGAPTICNTAPNTGGSLLRNRCRRMLDVYGSLVRLCKLTPSVTGAQTGAGPDFAPGAHHVPHSDNVVGLAYGAQQCLTPGTSFPSPVNTCPGLLGWFTVVWNACAFTNAAGVGAVNIPNIPAQFDAPSVVAPSYQLATPSKLCGTAVGATSATVWNVKGTAFKTSRCRRALDQFGRAGRLCTPVTNSLGSTDQLRWLAVNFGLQSPYCGMT